MVQRSVILPSVILPLCSNLRRIDFFMHREAVFGARKQISQGRWHALWMIFFLVNVASAFPPVVSSHSDLSLIIDYLSSYNVGRNCTVVMNTKIKLER